MSNQDRERMAEEFFKAGEANPNLSAKSFQLGWQAALSAGQATEPGSLLNACDVRDATFDSPLPVFYERAAGQVIPEPPTGDALDAKRYQWLCRFGFNNLISGSGTQSPGRGPYVAMSIPAVYAPAGGVMLESKAQIDSAIDTMLLAAPTLGDQG